MSVEDWTDIVQRFSHPEDCICFPCKLHSIHFAASCTPNRRPETVATNAREQRWHRDIPAYTSLVKDGVQPRSIDGCGDVIQSDADKIEIETGQVIPGKAAKRRAKDTLELLSQS